MEKNGRFIKFTKTEVVKLDGFLPYESKQEDNTAILSIDFVDEMAERLSAAGTLECEGSSIRLTGQGQEKFNYGAELLFFSGQVLRTAYPATDGARPTPFEQETRDTLAKIAA